jgi:membrane dipeptidase
MTTPLLFSRRAMLGTAAALAVPPFAARAAYGDDAYAGAIVIDAQGGVDTPFDAMAQAALRRVGLTAISQTMGRVGNGDDRYVSVIEGIAATRGLIATHPALLSLVTSAADLRAAKAAGRTGVILNVQDTSWMGSDLGRIATLANLGIRVVQLTYNVQNLAGDGAVEPGDGGLSILGRKIIAEVEKQKLVIDFSHGGRLTMAEGVAAAKGMPVITHTGCRALADHPRNTDDATLRAVADKGGFVGIYLMPYLAPDRTVSAEDVIRHIDHAFQVCGEDHIGIGTDGPIQPQIADADYRKNMKAVAEDRVRQGIAAPGDTPDSILFVEALNGPDKFRELAGLLSARGWPAARIEKLLGGNVARVFGSVWG